MSDHADARAADRDEREAELESLLRAGELLDPSLDQETLIDRTLEISLAVVRADVSLLVLRDERDETRTYARLRGESGHHSLAETRSRLARETLRTGKVGVQRDTETPGAQAAAELLGELPRVRVAAPLRRLDRVFGVLEVAYRVDPEKRMEDEERALRSVADHLAIALDAARLVRKERRRAMEWAHLIDIGTKISAHLDLDELLEAILLSMEELVRADAMGIFLIDRATGTIHNEVVRGYEDPGGDRLHLKVGKGILGWVAREGFGVNVPDVREDPRYVEARPGTRSEMAAPLVYEGQVIGVFNLESDQVAAFDDRDLNLLVSFSNQAAISITHARLHAEATEKRRLEDQLAVARTIQTRLLPSASPEIAGHVLAGSNVPSSAVGGDYFDFRPMGGDRWAVVVADVSGNGIPAGIIMAGFRAELRAELRREDDPCRVLSNVNRVLARELDPDYFVTAILGIYSPATGALIYSSAGHEPGLLVRRSGHVEQLSEGGLLLGVFEDASYRRAMVHLSPGDRLLLYTDGLSDAGDPWGDRLGVDGVLRLFRESLEEGTRLQDVPSVLLERAVTEAAGPSEEADDRTLVVLARSESSTDDPGNTSSR